MSHSDQVQIYSKGSESLQGSSAQKSVDLAQVQELRAELALVHALLEMSNRGLPEATESLARCNANIGAPNSGASASIFYPGAIGPGHEIFSSALTQQCP